MRSAFCSKQRTGHTGTARSCPSISTSCWPEAQRMSASESTIRYHGSGWNSAVMDLVADTTILCLEHSAGAWAWAIAAW